MADEDLSGGPNEAGEADAVVETGNDTEAKARELGWKPEEEWVGDKSGWVDAETFVQRRERQIAAADHVAQDQIKRLEKELAETRATIKDFSDWRTTVERRAYERATRDIEAQMRAAVKAGDVPAFDAANKAMQDLTKSVEQRTETKPAPTNPDEIPAFQDFIKDNGWYTSDPVLGGYADRMARQIAQQKGYTGTEPEFYQEIARTVREAFPDKFGGRRSPAVESGNGMGGRGGGNKAKSYDALPAEAKAACDKFVAQKLMTREQYVADYFAD